MNKYLRFILTLVTGVVLTGLLVGGLYLLVYACDSPRRNDAKIAKEYWETNLKNQEWRIVGVRTVMGPGSYHKPCSSRMIEIQIVNDDNSQVWKVDSLTSERLSSSGDFISTRSKWKISKPPDMIDLNEKLLWFSEITAVR